jgi:hypothetical protein
MKQKLVCISNENGKFERLEINKEYECINSYDEYLVLNIGNKKSYLDANYGIYSKKLFKTRQEIREEFLNQISESI